MDKPTEIMGHTLVRLRKESGKLQSEIAEATNLTQPAISKIENGESDPSAMNLINYCNALGVKVAEVTDQFQPGIPSASERSNLLVDHYIISIGNLLQGQEPWVKELVVETVQTVVDQCNSHMAGVLQEYERLKKENEDLRKKIDEY